MLWIVIELRDSHSLLVGRSIVCKGGKRSVKKKNRHSFFLWIHLPPLPLKTWNENVLRTILEPVCRLYRDNPFSEELPEGLFARVSLEVDISTPLKMTVKYIRSGNIYERLIDLKTSPIPVMVVVSNS